MLEYRCPEYFLRVSSYSRQQVWGSARTLLHPTLFLTVNLRISSTTSCLRGYGWAVNYAFGLKGLLQGLTGTEKTAIFFTELDSTSRFVPPSGSSSLGRL